MELPRNGALSHPNRPHAHWSLTSVCLRRRGTLLRTIWNLWWYGKNRLGSPDEACAPYHAVCSHTQIFDSLRRDQIYSIKGATLQVVATSKRDLVTKFINIAITWEPLDERVLLWIGMLTKPQRAALRPFILRLSLAHSRALLTGSCRSFTRATGAHREVSRLLIADKVSSNAWGRHLLALSRAYWTLIHQNLGPLLFKC